MPSHISAQRLAGAVQPVPGGSDVLRVNPLDGWRGHVT